MRPTSSIFLYDRDVQQLLSIDSLVTHGMGRGRVIGAQRRAGCARGGDNECDGEVPLVIVVENAYSPV
jgi:hypothetical protein